MAASSVDTIFENLGKMSVLELVELKNKIEEEWGITAAAPVAAAPAAGAGGDGAAAEEKTSFDVVLTDIKLPGMSGVDFLSSLRETHPNIPVIVMTAGASSR